MVVEQPIRDDVLQVIRQEFAANIDSLRRIVH